MGWRFCTLCKADTLGDAARCGGLEQCADCEAVACKECRGGTARWHACAACGAQLCGGCDVAHQPRVWACCGQGEGEAVVRFCKMCDAGSDDETATAHGCAPCATCGGATCANVEACRGCAKAAVARVAAAAAAAQAAAQATEAAAQAPLLAHDLALIADVLRQAQSSSLQAALHAWVAAHALPHAAEATPQQAPRASAGGAPKRSRTFPGGAAATMRLAE
jgi:hypothetical protein